MNVIVPLEFFVPVRLLFGSYLSISTRWLVADDGNRRGGARCMLLYSVAIGLVSFSWPIMLLSEWWLVLSFVWPPTAAAVFDGCCDWFLSLAGSPLWFMLVPCMDSSFIGLLYLVEWSFATFDTEWSGTTYPIIAISFEGPPMISF